MTQSRAQKETLVPGDKGLLRKLQEAVHAVGEGQASLRMLLEYARPQAARREPPRIRNELGLDARPAEKLWDAGRSVTGG